MTYEEEQIKYAEELKQIINEIKPLEMLFSDPCQTDARIEKLYNQRHPLECRKGISREAMFFGHTTQNRINRFREFLEFDYRQKIARKEELEHLLSQTPSERFKYNLIENVGKTIKFMGSITPQHVSGRVYQVENGDGCGIVSLCVIVIGIILMFILWLSGNV